jgi:hypothetical protein
MAEPGRPGRWSPRSATTALLAVAAAGAVAVGLLWVAAGTGRHQDRAANAEAAAGSPARGQPRRWDGARLVRGDPDRLTLYFVGAPPGPPDDPCARAYAATADPTAATVTVTLRELPGPTPPPEHGCTAIGHGRTVTIDLPEPLRDRPLVDGATGRQRPVLDAALLLTPSWLPPGYRLVSERLESGVDIRQWAPDRPDQRLLIEQGDADHLSRPGVDPIVLARPQVRGRPATVWKTRGFDDLVCVSWAEGRTRHRVCTSGTPGNLLPVHTLLRVANGLRAWRSRARPPFVSQQVGHVGPGEAAGGQTHLFVWGTRPRDRQVRPRSAARSSH